MTDSPKPSGAGRHLKIIGALVLAAVVLFVATRLDSFRAKLSDMAAVTEGRDAAARLTAPDSLLAYVLRHPQASLVVFDTDAPDEGLYVRADAEHPVVGVPALGLAAAYAEGVAAGRLDPGEAVRYDEIDAFALPAIEGDRHLATLAEMGLADTVRTQTGGGRPEETVSVQDEIPLRRVVEAAVRYGDRPSADYLALRFDRRSVRTLLRDHGVSALGAPVPTGGLYLAWTPPHRGATAGERLDGFLALAADARADTAFAVAERLRDDDAYRARERERLRFESLGLTVAQQRAAAEASFPRGTAQGYADLLAHVATGAFVSDSVSAVLHRTLGNPVEPFAPLVPGAEVRGKGGGFTGVYALGAYARRPDGTARVAVLLMHEVPTAVFIETGRRALDQGLVAGLLGSDAFFEQAKDHGQTSRANILE
jgi:hypothetical protein